MEAAHTHVAADPEAPTMKGVGFVNLRHYIERSGGQVHWADVLSALSEADREVVRSAVAVGWYDVHVFGRTLRAIDRLCGQGDLSLMEAIGAYECEQDFQRVLRVFLRVLSPAMLLKVQARLWRHFQSEGEIEISAGPGWILAEVKDWVQDEAVCTELGGYLQRMVRFIVRGRVALAHERCRCRGHAACTYRLTWQNDSGTGGAPSSARPLA